MSDEAKTEVNEIKPIILSIATKKISQQGIRDIEYMEERMKKNRDLYFHVRDKLFSLFNCRAKRVQIKTLGQAISKKIGVEFDRLAKRTMDGAICWFCENWNGIEPIIGHKNDDFISNNDNTIHNDDVSSMKCSTAHEEQKDDPFLQNINLKDFFGLENSIDILDWND